MAEITKPLKLNIVWSSSGVATAPTNTKYQTGWVVEAPPYQTVNYVFNKTDNVIAHLNQLGFLSWDAETEYQANKSWTRYNGTVYFCKTTHTNQNPASDVSETYWRPILDGQKVLSASAVSAFGLDLIDSTNATSARATLGATTVGAALFTTASTSTARTTLGATTVGSNVFTAASESAARTAIGVVQATEGTAGIAEVATDAEMITTADDKIVTPKKIRAGFGVSLTTNGYIAFPTWMGGLVIRWGQLFVVTNNDTLVEDLFPTLCLQVVAGLGLNGSGTDDQNPPFATPVTTGIRFYNPDNNDTSLIRYIAIGY